MEIELRWRWLWALVTVPIIATLIGLGYIVSPRAADGRPVLLLPEARAIEQYRRAVGSWAQRWTMLDQHMQAIQTTNNLLEQSQQAQAAFTEAVAVARQVEETESPPVLLGLRDQALNLATAYVEVTVALNHWVSAPTAENETTLITAYESATIQLESLHHNAWLYRSP